MPPPTHYAESGDVHIAYQQFGAGPLDLVVIPGFVPNVDWFWQVPETPRFLERLGSFARVVTSDKRGTGLADRGVGIPTLEERMDDVRAVMDTAAVKRAALLGISEGGPMSIPVKDPVAGSGIEFSARGAHELKGIPGEWQIFQVTT